MRKGQVKLIENAKKDGLADCQIAELSKEEYTLNFLNLMYGYFYQGKRRGMDAEKVRDSFYETLELAGGDINGTSGEIFEILISHGCFLTRDDKVKFMGFARENYHERMDVYMLYIYLDGLSHNLPEENLVFPVKVLQAQEREKRNGFSMSRNYKNCLESDFLRDDYIHNMEKSLLYHSLSTGRSLPCDWEDEMAKLGKLYDRQLHGWKTDNILDMLKYYGGESYYFLNLDAFNQWQLCCMEKNYVVVGELMEYCRKNMGQTGFNTFSERIWKDGNVKLKLEEALHVISPITTHAFTEQVNMRFGYTGFVSITHFVHNEIKGTLKNETGISFSNTKKADGKEFVISPDGMFFTKTKSEKLIPAPLKDVCKWYHGTCLKEMFRVIFGIHGNPFIDDCLSDTGEACIIPVSLNEMTGYRNRSEFIKAKYKTSGEFAVNWNRVNLNISYLILSASRYVKDKKSRSILALSRDTGLLTGIKSTMHKNEKTKRFLENIILERITGEGAGMGYDPLNGEYDDGKEDLVRTIRDYVAVCMEEKAGVDLRIDNRHLLERKHNEAMVLNYEKKTKPVKVPKESRYRAVHKVLPDTFEWIKTRKRLIRETAMQGHCVWTYADLITQDKCAIFSYMDSEGKYSQDKKPERFTVQVCWNKRRGFYPAQIKGRFNTNPKKELYGYVQDYLDKVNKKNSLTDRKRR